MHLSDHTRTRPEPLRTTLARLQRLGYTSVELAGEPDQYPISETRKLLQQYRIRCLGAVTIQTSNRDFTSPDPGIRQNTLEYQNSVVDTCAQLGGEIVMVVPGRVGKTVADASAEDEWVWAVEGVRSVAAYAQQRGVKIAVEPLNRFETNLITRVDQALQDAVGPTCGVALDTFHMCMEEKDLRQHRLAAGDGSLDRRIIIRTLRETGYDGGIAFESVPPMDRSPIGGFGAGQLEEDLTEVPPNQLQSIKDHGSGLISDAYYTGLLNRSIRTLRPLLE